MQNPPSNDEDLDDTTGQRTSGARGATDDGADTAADGDMASPDAADDDVDDTTRSRSDDSGQSSYGGFKDEGPADGRNHAADAAPGSDVGGMSAGSSNLGASLSDGVNGADDEGDDEDVDATSGVVAKDTQTSENRQR